MLQPKKVKYRKTQKGRMKGSAQRGHTVAFGDYGLKSIEGGWISDRQIEAARIAMTRYIKRGGKIWIRIFPDKPITKKPAETRMGKGKGALGGGGSPRPDAVRTGGRRPRHGSGGLPPGRPQAAPQDQIRQPLRRMTMAKTSELRDKSLDELREEERRLAQQVFKNRMELAAGQLTNVRVLSAVKRELARVKTLIREKSNQQ